MTNSNDHFNRSYTKKVAKTWKTWSMKVFSFGMTWLPWLAFGVKKSPLFTNYDASSIVLFWKAFSSLPISLILIYWHPCTKLLLLVWMQSFWAWVIMRLLRICVNLVEISHASSDLVYLIFVKKNVLKYNIEIISLIVLLYRNLILLIEIVRAYNQSHKICV